MFYDLILGTYLDDYDEDELELDYYYSSSEEKVNLIRSVGYVDSRTKKTFLNIFDK